ncbi:MAG: metallophosphoesterase family protein [Terriglobales bacterium]
MRILAASDIHGIRAVYDWIVRCSQSGIDAVVLAGDLLASDFEDEQRKSARALVEQLRSIPVPVLYIMGNDDNVSLGSDDDHLIPLHGRRSDVGGFSFVGYQFTPPFLGYAFVKPEAEIAADLEHYHSLISENTILVTHTPAFRHCDLSFGENCGSPSVAALLERRPALAHIHGHIHHQFGRSQNHFNVAAAGLCRAMIIELPSLKHSVIAAAANIVWTELP